MNNQQTKRIGKFALLKELGQGGMGVVYLAEDTTLRRRVALKVFRPPAGSRPTKRLELEDRFRRESRVAGALSHPNIVTIFDVGEEEGLQYIAMEFLIGQSLRDIIDISGSLPTDMAVDVAKQILSALAYAHGRGVVHRDIKPDNIIISPTGGVKITDFGIARIASEITISNPGAIVGSPNYMAPEQILGDPVDGRADLFATGAVLYEMLVGRKLFDGETIPEIAHKIANTEPDLSGKFAPRVEAALRRALSRDPRRRFETADQFLKALKDPLLLTRRSGVGDRASDDVLLQPTHAGGRSSSAATLLLATGFAFILALALIQNPVLGAPALVSSLAAVFLGQRRTGALAISLAVLATGISWAANWLTGG